MDENLRDFMSRDEQEQMDALVARALHRKERKKEKAAGSKQFQYFKCQCGCMEEMEGEDGADGKEPWEEEYFEVEIERLLRGICGFCLKHGLCQCACQKEKRKGNGCPDAADEELPFR